MTRMQTVRDEVRMMIRATPFRPFVLVMENGQQVPVGHPENIAFDGGAEDGSGGSNYFYVIGGKLRVFGTFDAVSNAITLDRAEV